MKRERGKAILAVIAVGVLITASLITWLAWPTPTTLVGHAAHNDIPGLKRALFLGADVNGYPLTVIRAS